MPTNRTPELVQAPDQSKFEAGLEAVATRAKEAASGVINQWITVLDVVGGTDGVSIDEFNTLAKGLRKHEDGVVDGVEWKPGLSKEHLQFEMLQLKQRVTADHLEQKAGKEAQVAGWLAAVGVNVAAPENLLAGPILKGGVTVLRQAGATAKTAARIETAMLDATAKAIPKQAAIDTAVATPISVAIQAAQGEDVTPQSVVEQAVTDFASGVVLQSAVHVVRNLKNGLSPIDATPEEVSRIMGEYGIDDEGIAEGFSLVSERPEDWRDPHIVDAAAKGASPQELATLDKELSESTLDNAEPELTTTDPSPAPPAKGWEAKPIVTQRGAKIKAASRAEEAIVRFAVDQTAPMMPIVGKRRVGKSTMAYRQIKKAVPEFNPRRSDHVDALNQILEKARGDTEFYMDEAGVPERAPLASQEIEVQLPARGYVDALQALIDEADMRGIMERTLTDPIDELDDDGVYSNDQEAAIASDGWIKESDMRIQSAVDKGRITVDQARDIAKMRDKFEDRLRSLAADGGKPSDWKSLFLDVRREIERAEVEAPEQAAVLTDLAEAAKRRGAVKGEVAEPLVNARAHRILSDHASELERMMIDNMFGAAAQAEAYRRVESALPLDEGPEAAARALWWSLGRDIPGLHFKYTEFLGKEGAQRTRSIAGLGNLSDVITQARWDATAKFKDFFDGDPGSHRFWGRVRRGDVAAQRDLHKEMWQSGSSGNADAAVVAAKLDSWWKDVASDLRAAGVQVGQLTGYTFRDYDPAKIKNNIDAVVNEFAPKLDTTRSMTTDPYEFMKASMNSILGWTPEGAGFGQTYAQQGRKIHMATEADDWDFWLRVGTDNNLFDLIHSTMQRSEVQRAMVKRLGPDPRATLERAAKTIQSSYNINGKPEEGKQYYRQVMTVADVLLGNFDTPMLGTPVTRNIERVRKTQSVMQTAAVTKWLMSDMYRTILAMSNMSSNSPLSSIVRTPIMFANVVASYGRAGGQSTIDFMRRKNWFKEALDKIPESDRRQFLKENRLVAEYMGHTFYSIQQNINDSVQAPSNAGRMFDEVLDSTQRVTGMLQQLGQLNEAQRNASATLAATRMHDMLMESKGDMAALDAGTPLARNTAVFLRQAGIGPKQWAAIHQEYLDQSYIDTKTNKLVSPVVENRRIGEFGTHHDVISTIGLEMSRPELAALVRQYLTQQAFLSMGMHNAISRSVQKRGGYFPAVLGITDKVPESAGGQLAAAMLSELTGTQMLVSAEAMRQATMNGMGWGMASLSVAVAFGFAAVAINELVERNADLEDIQDLQKFLNPDRVAAIWEATNLTPIAANVAHNLVRARSYSLGRSAPSPLSALSLIAENTMDRPMMGLASKLSGSADRMYNDIMFAGQPLPDTKRWPIVANSLIPESYATRMLGISLRDEFLKEVDGAAYGKRVGLKAESKVRRGLGWGIIMLPELSGIGQVDFTEEPPAPGVYIEEGWKY